MLEPGVGELDGSRARSISAATAANEGKYRGTRLPPTWRLRERTTAAASCRGYEAAKLLALASHDNIVVKITGACTLSRAPFPYDDLWDPLGRIFDAFGIDRCMWGTDWNARSHC